MRILSLAKKPGTVCGGRVSRPTQYIEEDEDDEQGITVDPNAMDVEEEDSVNPFIADFVGDSPPRSPESTGEDDPEVMRMLQRFADILDENGVDRDDWNRWVDEIMPAKGIETPEELEDFFDWMRSFADVLGRYGIDEEDWKHWVDVIIPAKGIRTPEELEEYLIDMEYYNAERKRRADEEGFDWETGERKRPRGSGLKGGTIDEDPFQEDAVRGVQAGGKYLPPEIVRHIGSYRDEGEDELFELNPRGTVLRGREISPAEENKNMILHNLLSLDDDFFEDEENRAHKYNKDLRDLIRKAGKIRDDPDFDRRYWSSRLRRTGGTDMPSPMPGYREYDAFRSVG